METNQPKMRDLYPANDSRQIDLSRQTAKSDELYKPERVDIFYEAIGALPLETSRLRLPLSAIRRYRWLLVLSMAILAIFITLAAGLR